MADTAKSEQTPAQKVWKAIVDSIRESVKGSDDVREITREMSLMNDLGADSLENIEVVLGVEDKLGITIPEDDLTKDEGGKEVPRFANLGQFADHVLGIFTRTS